MATILILCNFQDNHEKRCGLDSLATAADRIGWSIRCAVRAIRYLYEGLPCRVDERGWTRGSSSYKGRTRATVEGSYHTYDGERASVFGRDSEQLSAQTLNSDLKYERANPR